MDTTIINRISEYESNELDKLYEALAKAQIEIEVARNDSSNPYFKSKYADLTSIVKASRCHLAKNGLSIIQRILPKNSEMYLHTRLCHSSGQWIESVMIINAHKVDSNKSDIQVIGSYITYLRRYNYAAIVGVVTGDDDDGEADAQQDRKDKQKIRLTEIEYKNLLGIFDRNPALRVKVNNILKTNSIEHISDMPKELYFNIIKEDKKKMEATNETKF